MKGPEYSFFILYYFNFIFLEASENKCTDGQLVCDNGICVDPGAACNGKNDCGDWSDEHVACELKGCENNGTLQGSGSTAEDTNWWYECSRTTWRIRGCIVNDQRIPINETFFGFMGEFWGKCEMLGASYIRRRVKGCLDYQGSPMAPGISYLTDPLFWANCTETKQFINVPEEGKLLVNSMSRKIIGCYDGSPYPVANEEQFINITDKKLNLGIAYQCKLGNKERWPELEPIACVIGNNSAASLLDYIYIGNHCFFEIDTIVYYCSISTEKNVKSLGDGDFKGSWKYAYEIKWNVSTPEVFAHLRYKKYKLCKIAATTILLNGTYKTKNKGLTRLLRRRLFNDSLDNGRVFGRFGLEVVKRLQLDSPRVA